LAALVGPVQTKYYFPHRTLFHFIYPHRPASWAGSHAGSPVSLNMCLWPSPLILHGKCFSRKKDNHNHEETTVEPPLRKIQISFTDFSMVDLDGSCLHWYRCSLLRSRKYFFRLRFRGAVNQNYVQLRLRNQFLHEHRYVLWIFFFHQRQFY
jgi:hypothetical protein